MCRHIGIRAVAVFAAAASVTAPARSWSQARATAAQTDHRWYPWLGCWGPGADSAAGSAASGVTCVVPIAGSTGVEMLTFARGKVVARDRIPAGDGSHSVRGQGCDGFETVTWSSTGRRVYLRGSFTCGHTTSASTTILAMTPAGEFVRVEQVRSGGGAIVSVDRRRDVGVLDAVPAATAREIDARKMAITAARAASAAPITTDDVAEAVHAVDAGVVRSWLAAIGQTFDLTGDQVAALERADVPRSVLDVMTGQSQMAIDSTRPAARTVYVPVPTPAEQPPLTTMYRCPPAGCYAPNPYSPYNGYSNYPYAPYAYPYVYPAYPLVYSSPVIVRRVTGRDRFHRPAPPPRKPVGIPRRPRPDR